MACSVPASRAGHHVSSYHDSLFLSWLWWFLTLALFLETLRLGGVVVGSLQTGQPLGFVQCFARARAEVACFWDHVLFSSY